MGQNFSKDVLTDRGHPKDVACALLGAWSSGDLQTASSLLADEVTFDGPLGATRGPDGYLEGIEGMVKIVERTDLHEVFDDGEDVLLIYDLVTKDPPAKIPTAGWYKVHEAKVAAVRAYFDPRPLLSGGNP